MIVSTIRGMGKTFLLKMIGLQQLPPHCISPEIQQSSKCCRVLSFDFSAASYAIQNVGDVTSFFVRLMIFYLCRMFNGCQVDGINFVYDSFQGICCGTLGADGIHRFPWFVGLLGILLPCTPHRDQIVQLSPLHRICFRPSQSTSPQQLPYLEGHGCHE
jgi:hypothetical protein